MQLAQAVAHPSRQDWANITAHHPPSWQRVGTAPGLDVGWLDGAG